MSVIDHTNRQDSTPYALASDGPHELLVGTDAYPVGMSVNGGKTLHLEIDGSDAPANVALQLYRRTTPTSPWSPFDTGTVTATTVFSDDFEVGGYSAVRVTGTRAAGIASFLNVSATIT